MGKAIRGDKREDGIPKDFLPERSIGQVHGDTTAQSQCRNEDFKREAAEKVFGLRWAKQQCVYQAPGKQSFGTGLSGFSQTSEKEPGKRAYAKKSEHHAVTQVPA